MRELICWWVACGFCLSVAAAGCGKDGNGGKGANKYGWLIINYDSYAHVIDVDINGKRYTSYTEKAGGFEVKPTPLVEGDNHILVTFTPRPAGERFGSDGKVQFLLSPSMIPGSDPLPGVTCTAEPGAWEYDIHIQVAGGAPGRMTYVCRAWSAPDRKVMVHRERVDTNIFSKEWDSVDGEVWTDKGKPFSVESTRLGKIVSATYYKPDGSVGATVADGKGWFRWWYEDGTIQREVPVMEGRWHGLEKHYDADGKVMGTVLYDRGTARQAADTP